MSITPQDALLRCIEHREIFHDEMLSLFRQIMRGELFTGFGRVGFPSRIYLLE